MIWVVDASVAVRWFLSEETHPHADAVLRRMLEEPSLFAVPELFPFEVFAVLCRLHPSPLDAFVNGFLPVLQAGILRHPMTERLARAAEPFVKLGLTGYDATYAALAADLGGTWLTFDHTAHRQIARRGVSMFLGRALPDGL